MEVRYTPGPRFVVVGKLAVAVLDPDVSAEVLERVWRTLLAGGGVGEVLQDMTGSYGTNLAAIPPFAVVAPALDGAQLAVRGRLVVRVLDHAGLETVSGVGVSTWSERWVPAPESLEILSADAGAGSSGEPSGHALPIGLGVVKAETVWLMVTEVSPEIASGLSPEMASGLSPEMASGLSPEVVSGVSPVVVDAAATDVGGGASLDSVSGVSPVVAITAATDVVDGLGSEVEPVPASVTTCEPPYREVTLVEVGEPALPDEPVDVAEEQMPTPGSEARMTAPTIDSHEQTMAEAEDSYDHLWGPTVMRRVEDAAVREAEEPEGVPSGASLGGPLISYVPGVGSPAEAIDEPGGGDHDGETIMSDRLAAIRSQVDAVSSPSPGPVGAPTPPGQTVLARMCDAGHPNPPQSRQCGVCAADLVGESSRVSRPTLGRMLLSTGPVFDLDRPVLVGRKPRVSRVQGADLPRLVTVPSPQQDISRSHLEVRLEEWHVLVVDLGTTNGTILLRPGQPPRRLHPHETVMIRSADIVDIGDGITITFEAVP
jgi:hypothetical protein